MLVSMRVGDNGVGRHQGDGCDELPGYYPFDLLVLRGAFVNVCRDGDSLTLENLRGLPFGSRGGDDHPGSLF